MVLLVCMSERCGDHLRYSVLVELFFKCTLQGVKQGLYHFFGPSALFQSKCLSPVTTTLPPVILAFLSAIEEA